MVAYCLAIWPKDNTKEGSGFEYNPTSGNCDKSKPAVS